MSIMKKLYSEKYRPKNIDGMILLPRIHKIITNATTGEIELPNNILLSGSSSGTGKSTLAKILTPKGALHVNASYSSSVEDLRDEVTDYCRVADIFADNTLGGYKIVYLDEFDGVSAKYQEALRGFIEEYSDRVRFIATCNNKSKISSAMLSRFTVIEFDPQTTDEELFLKDNYLERCQLIKEKNGIKVTDEEMVALINNSFPDLRSVFNSLQVMEQTGGSDKRESSSTNLDLYKILMSKVEPDKTYAWVMENFGDRVDGLLKMCGRPLAQYIFQNKPDMIKHVPKIMPRVTYYSNNLGTAIDPLVLALALIYDLQEILK